MLSLSILILQMNKWLDVIWSTLLKIVSPSNEKLKEYRLWHQVPGISINPAAATQVIEIL